MLLVAPVARAVWFCMHQLIPERCKSCCNVRLVLITARMLRLMASIPQIADNDDYGPRPETQTWHTRAPIYCLACILCEKLISQTFCVRVPER